MTRLASLTKPVIMKNCLIALTTCILLFSACSSEDDPLFVEYSKNRDLWNSQNIDSYQYAERLSCFCGGILNKSLVVKENVKDTVYFEIPTWYPPETTIEDLYDGVLQSAKTIDEAFDFIEEVLQQDVDYLGVEYHETYGFPIAISVNYVESYSDDEIFYGFSDFELID